MDEPKLVMKRVLDVVPHYHGIWCSVGGGEPFVNTIVMRRWSEDGRGITFMLDTHNFVFSGDDDEMEVVELGPDVSDKIRAMWAEVDGRSMGTDLDVAALAARARDAAKRLDGATEALNGALLAAERAMGARYPDGAGWVSMGPGRALRYGPEGLTVGGQALCHASRSVRVMAAGRLAELGQVLDGE